MPSAISDIELKAREYLEELSPRHWSSDELTKIIAQGIKDLWRSIVDLKGEHFLTVNTTDVYLPANSDQLAGVPADVHKVYLIEPRDISVDGAEGRSITFRPTDYNHAYFVAARSQSAVDAGGGQVIFYAITGQGSPVNAPKIYVAPKTRGQVNLRFAYVPTLPAFNNDSTVPIPGECDSALTAWTVAFARAKEREDRAPDPKWLQIYQAEKEDLLQSLGLRQYHEYQVADAIFEEYW